MASSSHQRLASVAALVVLVASAGGAVVLARHTRPQALTGAIAAVSAADLPLLADSAPAIRSTVWLNSAPLAPDDLAGKVVLYDFWTFDCINCQHTLAYLKAWYARYAKDGLVVLGIHTPEFDFERQPGNVAAYVSREGIRFPVALDPDRVNWDAFENHYWPNFYLHDRAGRRRYSHIGEGSYRETEDAIRVLLGVNPASPRANVA